MFFEVLRRGWDKVCIDSCNDKVLNVIFLIFFIVEIFGLFFLYGVIYGEDGFEVYRVRYESFLCYLEDLIWY